MARTQKPASAGSKSRPSRKKAAQPTDELDVADTMGDSDLSVAGLKAATAKNREEYCKSSHTHEAYQGQVKWGKEFLARCIAERRKKGCDADLADGVNTDLLEKAFDNPPNIHSVDALEMFLSQRCFTEGLAYSTAESIHAAFANYWDNMDGKKYAGPYVYHQTTQTWYGCPARAPVIQETLKAIKNKHVAEGVRRRQAEAMTLEDLAQIMRWSEATCPQHRLVNCPAQLTMEDQILNLTHAFMRAFMSTAFTLWTRNFELCNLQSQGVDRNLIMQTSPHKPATFFTIHLTNRKGWMSAKSGPDGPLQNNVYEIHKQSMMAMDMFTHLRVWLWYLETALGRKLESHEYIFPYISPNCQIHASWAVSHEYIQSLITKFTRAAGLEKNYTTHCFRRGGAQYRFMFAPAKDRWSLNVIRWWGGWAKGEHVDTLMKYLFNSLQSYESGHSDALCPIQDEPDKSFMGDHKVLQPATNEDLHVFSSTLFDTLKSMLGNQVIHGGAPPITTQHPSPAALVGVAEPAAALGHPVTVAPPTPFASVSSTSQPSARKQKPSQQRLAPIPGAVIPDIPQGPNAWKVAVRQWDEFLRDWEPYKYTGPMRLVNGTKRSVRETIAVEYDAYLRDEAHFLRDYPQAARGIDPLVKAIRKRHGRQHKSRNGTPEEHELSSTSTSMSH